MHLSSTAIMASLSASGAQAIWRKVTPVSGKACVCLFLVCRNDGGRVVKVQEEGGCMISCYISCL